MNDETSKSAKRGCLCDDWKLFLYLTGIHFRGELQHVDDISDQKIKL